MLHTVQASHVPLMNIKGIRMVLLYIAGVFLVAQSTSCVYIMPTVGNKDEKKDKNSQIQTYGLCFCAEKDAQKETSYVF